ncbi:MAG: hydrogenase nickel incorporation protein HypB [Planctomycetota bacterium]
MPQRDAGRREVKIGSPVMARNDALAAENRSLFQRLHILAVNLISSPGSGKTTLLEALAGLLGDDLAVIEGDVQTRRDAERIAKKGCAVFQIETGGACHLNAEAVGRALAALNIEEKTPKILVIENVGNLICPAAFDLGEEMKAAILSVPEGDDKVLKYPAVFSRIAALLVNKIDLLPHLEFDPRRAVAECRSLNAAVEAFYLSARTGEGVDRFCAYLLEKRSASLA